MIALDSIGSAITDQDPTLLTKIQRCIAVVDDDMVMRTALSSLLRAAGYRVVLFASGEHFLESLNVFLPDCVLVDLLMPGISGLDVLSRLTADQRDIPAIVVTGSTDEALERKALAAGARMVVKKHVRAEQLFAALDEALAREA